MEWVETTGRTLEEAKDAALDQLGVDERDAEFEVLAEPKSGLFGRVRGEARVRARVRPTQPRAKAERRERRGRKSAGARAGGRQEQGSRPKPEAVAAAGGGERPAGEARRRRRGESGSKARPAAADQDRQERPGDGAGEGSVMDQEEVSVERQADHVETFVVGLLEAFGLDGSVSRETVDEDTEEVRVEGSDLGLLIGPKGQTLNAVQDLARTVVQRHEPGIHLGRVRIDIGGYRQRRREALERFTRDVAQDVIASGKAKSLEPMNPADRKVVHDTANTIDGVATASEGVEPHRRVVILPAEG